MNPSDHVDATSKPSHTASPGLKEKVIEEFRMFWVIAIYLALMFAAFNWSRELISAEYGISYLHHGAALIEALILAKVILVGQAMGLGKRYEGEPLILSVLFKSVVFAVFVAFFSVIEHLVEGLIHHETWGRIAHGLVTSGRNEIIARTLRILVAFIPFFAFLETDRVMGDHKLFNLFFRKRAV
jgi:hypothetical protein